MCIVYFASHSGCTHHHILGAWNCTLNCSTASRHTFYLSDNEDACLTCVYLRGEELDPDIHPVKYYAPLFDNHKLKAELREVKREEQENRAKGKREVEDDDNERGDEVVRDYKALSDPESLTSEWRQNDDYPAAFHDNQHPASHHKDEVYTSPAQHIFTPTTLHPTPHHNTYSLTPNVATPDTTPRTAAHRTLVQEQLDKLEAARKCEAHGPSPVPGSGVGGGWWNGMARYGRMGRGME